MEKIIIGEIVKPQGIKGELKIKPYVDDFKIFDEVKNIYLGSEIVGRSISSVSVRQNYVYAMISGIESRNIAEAYRNKLIYVEEDFIKSRMNNDEYLIDEMLESQVYFEDGKIVGKLYDVQNFGSADVYYLETEKGKLLFSNVPDVIISINVKEKKIVVNEKRFGEVSIYED